MSIATLVQVYDETRRLAIAGSSVAPGDFRLKKLIPPLEQAGTKAPVFAKVAQSITAVVESNEKTASTALLDLTTLVNAILYTQGETGAAGELKPLPATNLGGEATQASARVLKPLLEALGSTGSGRLELIRDAIERGAFRDLRLVKPALFAIDDPYSEIGDLIVEKVLPLYGKAILPELRAKLDIKAKTSGHQNRLKLMHKLDPGGSRDVVQNTLADGSKEMRVVAIECLGNTDADLPHLFEHAKAKAKDVRQAALRALTASRLTAASVLTTIKNAIAGNDIELIIQRVRESPLPEIQDFVLAQAEEQFAATLKLKDAKAQGPAIARLQYLLACLQGRKDAAAETFLLKCFDNRKAFAAIKSEPSGSDLNEQVARILAHGTPAMQKKLAAEQATLSGPMLSSAILAARSFMPPAEFYSEFSPVLKGFSAKKGRKSSDNERASILAGILTHGVRQYYYHYVNFFEGDNAEKDAKAKELDPRWLDSAIETGDADLVCALARSGHDGVNKFLSEHLAAVKKNSHEATNLLQAMVRIGHPGIAEAIMMELKRQAKDATPYFYGGYWLSRLIAELPKSAAPKFEELLPTLPERMIDQLADAVATLQNKPD
ncbi:MAG TPA: hypothetical protein VHM90_18780, partial [Phycisphaerae bacterium]|jgi:hypothetical protein|nr:hypothetical protein [Phycisphaerae bacterium]